MSETICAVCGQEVRIATVVQGQDPSAPLAFAGGTAWLHRPPGPADHHRPRFGNLTPVIVARVEHEEEADSSEPIVLSVETGSDRFPTAALRLVTQLREAHVSTFTGYSVASVVSKSPTSRGERVELSTAGLHAWASSRHYVGTWEHNAGSAKPSWSLTVSTAWGPGRARGRMAARDAVAFLTNRA